MLLPFPLAVVADVVSELVRQHVLSELLYAGDLASISKTIDRLRDKS